MKPDIFQNAIKAVEFLRSKLPQDLRHPKIGIVCGSGLGGLKNLTNSAYRFELPYASIPYFPKSTGELDRWKSLANSNTSGQLKGMRANCCSAKLRSHSPLSLLWSAEHSKGICLGSDLNTHTVHETAFTRDTPSITLHTRFVCWPYWG